MKKTLSRIFQLILVVSVIIAIQHCGSDDSGLNATGDYISGTITFQDSLIRPSSDGKYCVSFYTDLAQPPVRSDSLSISMYSGTTTSFFKSSGLASNNYFVTCTWTTRSNGAITVLGTLGCVTPPSCSNPTKIEFPSYAGTAAEDFKSLTH